MTLRKVKALQSISRRQAGSTLTPLSAAFIINCLKSALKRFFLKLYLCKEELGFLYLGKGVTYA
jgi:hypothetical protein